MHKADLMVSVYNLFSVCARSVLRISVQFSLYSCLIFAFLTVRVKNCSRFVSVAWY